MSQQSMKSGGDQQRVSERGIVENNGERVIYESYVE